MMLLHLLVFILAAKCISSATTQPPPKAENDTDYILPTDCSPVSYNLQLNLEEDVFKNKDNSFSGVVTISLIFLKDTDYISLHAHHSFITLTNVTFNDIVLGKEDYEINKITDILKIKAGTVTTGKSYDLVIEYTGLLSTTDMYGFYKSSYSDKTGATKYLATTQFEATYARRAFPCFDEPSFKATFDVSITAPQSLKVLFNTEEDNFTINNKLATHKFKTTPKMSTYLLAFVISQFTCTPVTVVDQITYKVCSRGEFADARALAADLGPQVLKNLSDFTGIKYTLPKMDQVAIPDFAAGAMENWGLVTYRESDLLYNANESSNRYKQGITTVIAHEFSHQWFGDLVTLKWWSETFLNEGFATYFEYHIADKIQPTWELTKQFVTDVLQVSLESDSLANSQAIQSDCYTPAQINAKFGTISYSKGGSVLRMVQHFMNLDNFKAGLTTYLTNNENKNTEPAQLWDALSKSVDAKVSKLPGTLSNVMENWITKAGFPLLTVTSTNDGISVAQDRFLFSGEDNVTKWYVPISYTTSEDTSKLSETAPSDWLTPTEDLKISLPKGWEWVILNNQVTGYYRVNYESSLWDKIQAALLKHNFDGIGDVNRAQLVDDMFNLARVNKIKYSQVFDFIRFLTNDTSYYPWAAAFNGYSFLLKRVGDTSELGKAISNELLQLMDNLYKSVPVSQLIEDDQIYTLKQVLVLTWACKLGSESCVNEVQQQFGEYKSSGTRPNKNLRAVVYCSGLRYSKNETDWSFLWDAYTKSTNLLSEQVTILSALGCTEDKTLLNEYLNKSITDGSGIRPQNTANVFSSVYSGSSVGPDVAFDFLNENYKEILEKYNSANSLGNVIKGIADKFTTTTQVNKLKDFINKDDLPEEIKIAGKEAVETAEGNLKWLSQFETDLKNYYDLSGVSKLEMSFSIILPVVFTVFLLH